MKKILWLLTALGLFGIQLPAHADITREDILAVVDESMAIVGEGNWVAGLTTMQPYLNITQDEYEDLVERRTFIGIRSKKKYGSFRGSDFLELKEMGGSLMQLDYVEKFSKQMVRWRFYLYKPGRDWVINDVQIDTRQEIIYSGF